MALLGLRWIAAAAFVGAATMGALAACGGKTFTLVADDGGSAGDDSGVTGDADMSDGGAGDAVATGFCATQGAHFLCDDFDERAEGNVKGSGNLWDDFTTSPDSDGLLDRSLSKSPSHSFLVDTSRGGITTEQVASLLSKTVGHAKTVSLSYDILLETFGGDASDPSHDGVFLNHLAFGPLTYDFVFLSPTSTAVVETLTVDGGMGQSMSAPIAAGFSVGVWKHVDIQIVVPQTLAMGGAVTVTFDGAKVLTHPLTFMTPVGAGVGTLSIGLILFNAPSIWKIHYDNVIIDRTL